MGVSRGTWETAPVRDLASYITVGFVGSMSSLFVDAGVPLLRGQNILPYSLNLTNLKYISKETHRKWKKSALQAGDVAIVRVGYPGTACVIPEGLGDLNAASLVIIRPNRDLLDSHFLCYVLNSPWGKAEIKGRLVGAAQQVFNTQTAAELEVPVPPLSIQRKIAAILVAYDDLIENNLRRIKILEEMAQSLYREWFVKFRFPGHQHARFTDSPLGRIPEEWEVVPFTEIADVLSGGTPKTTEQEYWGGSIPFFAPKDAPESFYVTNTEKAVTEIGLRKCNSKLYPKDTVFITARGTVGKVLMPSTDMAMNQSCYALRGKQGISQLYLFFATREQANYLKKNTGGATFDTIVVDTFRRMLVARPGNEIIARFSQLIQPGTELILNMLKKNITLRRTRDLLLPRLISGEVDMAHTVTDLSLEQ
jgi:type I restriction enzyme S subunit